MTAPSFERINYALRPAKNIERKMLCEAFSRLVRVAPLREYRYVGFGSIGFHDFSLFHQRLGIDDMISIEARERLRKRFAFNRPYSCIRMRWGLSYDVLPLLSWTRRSIVWLDYEDRLSAKMLEDIQLLAGALPSGSALVVTVNAEPVAVPVESDDLEIQKKRLEELVLKVGEERVPLPVSGKDLAGWGLAMVCRDIIHSEIEKTVTDRNLPLSPKAKVRYQQLFNFQYADGSSRMLSIGGLLLDPADSAKVQGDFDDLDFVRTGDEPYVIQVPILTIREVWDLDSRLPRSTRKGAGASRLPSGARKQYGRVYRHFPTFSEIEV